MRSRAKAVTISTPSSRGACRMYEISVSSTSNGTLFFSFHRNIGSASCADRGNSSKCCTNTRITGSGRSSATSSSLARSRDSTHRATARFTAASDPDIGFHRRRHDRPRRQSFHRETVQRAGSVRTRAMATRSGEISIASGGCGVASSQRVTLRTNSLL